MSKYQLKILGKVSKSALQKINFKFGNSEAVFFVDFAKDCIPVGTEFTKILMDKDEICHIKIIKITQQYGKEFKEIPDGWKTIVELQTQSKTLINMPAIDDWYASDCFLIIEK